MIPGVTELAMGVAGSAIEGRVQQAMINALQVFGTLVLVSVEDFLCIVDHQECPLVVETVKGRFRKQYVYVSSFQGLAFCAKTRMRLVLPERALLIVAKKAVLPI